MGAAPNNGVDGALKTLVGCFNKARVTRNPLGRLGQKFQKHHRLLWVAWRYFHTNNFFPIPLYTQRKSDCIHDFPIYLEPNVIAFGFEINRKLINTIRFQLISQWNEINQLIWSPKLVWQTKQVILNCQSQSDCIYQFTIDF